MITLFQHQQQALMDAMRYGLEDMLVGPAFSFD